jgi:hypothetical protein
MKMKLSCALLTVGFAVIVACSMAAQETPRPVKAAIRTKQPAKPPAKKSHKVWSNDDMATLRTPEDKYLEAKETTPAPQPTAVPTASAKPAPPTKAPAPASTSIKLPDTIEQTEQVIGENTQYIVDSNNRLRQLKAELGATPETQRALKQAEIERCAKLIEETEAGLKILQDHLQKLRAKQPVGNSTSSK